MTTEEAEGWWVYWETTSGEEKEAAQLLHAEYDRRGAVEQAVAEYMLSCLCNGGTDSPELNADINTKFAVLLDAVRTNGEFRG